MTAAQHSSAAAVLRSAKSDEMKAVLCEHSATLTLPEECRAGNIAGILTLLDGSADVDAKSDGEGVGAPLHAGHGTTEARERAGIIAMRRCKESSREAAMRQYLTRKHHFVGDAAVPLFYEAFGVRVSRKCY